MHSCGGKWNLGHDAINKIAIDSAKTLCACATDGQDIILLDPVSYKVTHTHTCRIQTIYYFTMQDWKLEGHTDHRVLAVMFTSEADGLISTAHDGTFTVWQ